jgi:molybdenum cofactor synthesis domain-containing protein
MANSSNRVTAAVLIIGNEILSGRTQDTNLAYLAKKLNEYGIQIREARVVPDIEAEIVEAVNALRARFDYVFTTGGIGPTHDDITAECIAAASVVLVVSPEIAAILAGRRCPSDGRAHAHGTHTARGRVDRKPAGAAGLFHRQRLRDGRHPAGDAADGRFPGRPAAARRDRSITQRHGLSGREPGGPAPGPDSGRDAHIDLGSYPFQRDARYGTTLVMRRYR